VDPERLVVGRIAKAHGINGEVAVDVLSDAPDRFGQGARVFAGDRTLTVATARAHHGRLLVRFEEVPDRNGAEALRGTELTIPAEEAAALDDEWSFYPHQLVGFAVTDEKGETLGTMIRVDESPGADLWVVGARGREVLVPAVRDIVVAVDLDARVIVLRPPDGLF
jgi:16S rRNA processing protein RimM